MAGDVVVGVSAVFEGVTGSEVVMGEATCTGCVQLPVTVMVLLPSVDSDEKRGGVKGVVPGPGYAGHWSVSTDEELSTGTERIRTSNDNLARDDNYS